MKTNLTVTTDGEENSSRSFTYEKVREMITHQEKKYGWEFLSLGRILMLIRKPEI